MRALTLRERLDDIPGAGTLTWAGVRPEHYAPMIALPRIELVAERGVEGDVTARSGRAGGKRQVTLVQEEHLAVLAAFMGKPVTPTMLRRNLVVRGINLLSLVKQRFQLGDAILVGTGACAPCGKMDEILGPGGFQAMRGHGGITAMVERGGLVELGARVTHDPITMDDRADQ